jgi:hypothetical protein
MLRVLRKVFRSRERSVVKFRLDFDLLNKSWKFVSLR